MTITIEIAPELQAELARQAATRGMAIDAYAAGLLQGAARRPIPSESQLHPPAEEVVDAIDRLKSFGKAHALSLGGMTIRELRHEARP
jgi:hypothetical protein